MPPIMKKPGPRPPRGSGQPPVPDRVDWTQKLLYGADHQRLISVAEARCNKSPEALQGMLMAALGDGEVAYEAREAAVVIISTNPGHREVLDIVPDLVSHMGNPRLSWILSAIAEANPSSPECRRAVPALERVLAERKDWEDEPLREAVFALGCLGGPSSAAAVKRFILSGRPTEGSDLWNTAMRTLRKLEPQ